MLKYLSEYRVRAETASKAPDFPCLQLNQIHSGKVLLVDKDTPPFLEGDGMITQELHLPLAIRHADCQVAIVYDPSHHAVGIAHAGWKGQVQSIYTHMIHLMRDTFTSSPRQLVVAFAPSLGPSKSEFINYKNELLPWMWEYEEKENHFNLWKIAEAELLSCGIQKENIALPTICTYLDEKFYSYRRTKTAERNFTFVGLF